MTLRKRHLIATLLLGACLAQLPARARAADDQGKTRDFYSVLDDVLSDFEYDLKNGNVGGLKDLSIRNIATSENIPPSFRSHLELLVAERILKTSKTRILQCLPCRAKRTMLSGNQVIVSSTEDNPVELARIAKEEGIQNFMDISFAYQPTGMMLSLFITDPQSGSIIWTHSYNSESSRASAFRRGVDYSQIDDGRKQSEYVPMIQYRLAVLYMFEPNVGGATGCIGGAFRAVERYDNRKKEVGFELDYLHSGAAGAATTAGATPTLDLYSGFNLTLMFVHAWNLIGEEENFNSVRGSILLGVGGTYASGYLGGVFRAQYEWRLGKHYAVTPSLGYRPASTAFLGTVPVANVSGLEFGAGVSILF